MTDLLPSIPSAASRPSRPPLPEPRRERWQPLRLGLVDLFLYDSEEFWFHDGHLLLRGNNGTGKSKVLSLTLPLLFDANLRPARVEPDADAGKRMSWNLLMGNYPRRIGYSWIEFGRRDSEGVAQFLTLGVGLSAVEGRAQVDSWFFLLEGDALSSAPRLGEDLWLTSEQQRVLTREQLREAIGGRGQIFESAKDYRRAVDERLFQLGAQRYDALMDTLVQLRQPQLSKKPDEAELSHALGESLPPLQNELLADVAESLNRLEEDRHRLEDTRQLQRAVTQFEQRYRVYSGMLARRQARTLRQAQTGFDNASAARNEAQAALEAAQRAETEAIAERDNAHRGWIAARERVETLQGDPRNRDAQQLAQAQGEMQRRRGAATEAAQRFEDAHSKLQRETRRGAERDQLALAARDKLDGLRAQTSQASGTIGIEAAVAQNPLLALNADALADSPAGMRAGNEALQASVTQRRHDLALLRRRHVEFDQKRAARALADDHQRAARDDSDMALEQRRQADQLAEREGAELVEGWSRHGAGLQQLRFDVAGMLDALVAWVARPEGENPARRALYSAWQEALTRYATRAAALDAALAVQHEQRALLEAERQRLLDGEDAIPPEPATRAPGVRDARAGAPLWRLVDFHPKVSAAERAGLEAALEASGLLDAWLSPDGLLTDATGQSLQDAQWTQRAPVSGPSLNEALRAALPEGSPITDALLSKLLTSVACSTEDPPDAESWISPDGRFRIGALAGAWHKPEARYIGHSARERARRQRLQEIAATLGELEAAEADLAQQLHQLLGEREQARQEQEGFPGDQALLTSVAAAAAAGHQVVHARQRLEQAEARLAQAEESLRTAQEQLQHDATDLRLPAEAARLPEVEQALEKFDGLRFDLAQAADTWQHERAALGEQRQREEEARVDVEQADVLKRQTREEADQASVRFKTLERTVGADVETLQREISEARGALQRIEGAREKAINAQAKAGEKRAVAEVEARQKEQTLAERGAARTQAAEALQRFAATGLLASALPQLAQPQHWSIDPALNLARRIEQELRQLPEDEASWTRIARQISSDQDEMQRTLNALGHRAVSEQNDAGFIVHIQYQNRTERPDTLAALLEEDITQRSELLSAREREVLENHLQAEIAAEIQRLMRAASERVSAINEELRKRPTSTGVRYRLRWEPLSTEEGAPEGLEVARERLLNTSADLWSVEDRNAVGTMLQQRIAGERARTDAAATEGSLVDQLSRALDYRHWHRFSVQRLQDGQWRKLSGPASSGERALGLTVPLFAAIASFYGHEGSSHGASPLAPRLMLLDEAFAGIDDAARAHCMGLIHEFDLDFVLTSEREWGCYAELPGVAICQLQRREGVDAVFVSRWTWDGSAPRRQADPDRRFPPA